MFHGGWMESRRVSCRVPLPLPGPASPASAIACLLRRCSPPRRDGPHLGSCAVVECAAPAHDDCTGAVRGKRGGRAHACGVRLGVCGVLGEAVRHACVQAALACQHVWVHEVARCAGASLAAPPTPGPLTVAAAARCGARGRRGVGVGAQGAVGLGAGSAWMAGGGGRV